MPARGKLLESDRCLQISYIPDSTESRSVTADGILNSLSRKDFRS